MFMATLKFALGEEIDALRELVQSWAQDRVAPMAARIDRDNLFPAELWREMGELGLLGITVPEEYGGAGMGYLAHVVAVEEMYRTMAIANYEDRFVIPSTHREYAENAYDLKGSCGFSFGNGCSDGASAPSLFSPKKKNGVKTPLEV